MPYPPTTSRAAAASTAHHRRRRSLTAAVRRLGVGERSLDGPDDPPAALVGVIDLHQIALSQVFEHVGVGGVQSQAVAHRDDVVGAIDGADGADCVSAMLGTGTPA